MEKTCKIEGCKKTYKAKGYCAVHYKKWRHAELPKPRYKICHMENCRKPMLKGGKCKEHYEAMVTEKIKATAPKAEAAAAAPQEAVQAQAPKKEEAAPAKT
jgi:hypothetical protein